MVDEPTQGVKVASGGAYGDRKAMESLQSSAPLAGSPGLPSAPQVPPSMLASLDAPTNRPSEPITAGADAGAGPSAGEAGILTDQQMTDEQLRPYLRSLQLLVNLPGSNAEARSIVRLMKARLASD